METPLEKQTFLWLLLIVSLLFIWIIFPFFAPVFWAVAIAIIFRPVYTRLNRRFKRWPNLAALITLMLCLVIVIIPAIVTITSVINEGVNLYQSLQSGEIDTEAYLQQMREAFPAIQGWIDRFNIDLDELRKRAMESLTAGGAVIAQGTLLIGQNLFSFLVALGVMLYVAFFLIRDGDRLVILLMRALPLNRRRKRLLLTKFAEVTRATIKGNIVIAVVQGVLGGLIFWALGIPGPLLWGVVMAALSLIPAIGAGLVWVPVSIYLLATGDYVRALILIPYGVIVIGLVDNFLRPILVGRDTKLPDYIVLLSTLGGLILLGINGFVMGPVIASLFTVSWGIFIREFRNADVPYPRKKTGESE